MTNLWEKFNKSKKFFFILIFTSIVTLSSKPVLAYAGPGVAIGAVIVFLTIIVTFFASFFLTFFKYIKKAYLFIINSLRKKSTKNSLKKEKNAK